MEGFNRSTLKVCRMLLVFQAVSDAGQNVCSVGNLAVHHFFFSNNGAGIQVN